MEKINSAFTLLYILSLCDDYVSQSEIDIIHEWIKSTACDHLSFNSTPIINDLELLSPIDQHRKFYSAALTFQTLTDIHERLNFFRSALLLIYADHKLEPTEQVLIDSLAHWWNINLPPFLTTPLTQVKSYPSPSDPSPQTNELSSLTSGFGHSFSINPDSHLSLTNHSWL